MFLAEDRVLCFELLAAKDKRWQLHYEKNARAETDVPPDLWTLIRQRRRCDSIYVLIIRYHGIYSTIDLVRVLTYFVTCLAVLCLPSELVHQLAQWFTLRDVLCVAPFRPLLSKFSASCRAEAQYLRAFHLLYAKHHR
jgi:cellulose synthase/poly-beta-1,6-N-acetylglucosamine synthase-like glycosyltransferase